MVGAATGHQEDLLVVEAGERSFQGGRGEDALVAGLQERVALGVNGFEGELTDLVAREGTLDFFLAHGDRAVSLVIAG